MNISVAKRTIFNRMNALQSPPGNIAADDVMFLFLFLVRCMRSGVLSEAFVRGQRRVLRS